MYGYRLGAMGIAITFFAIIFSTVLMPMVLFNPKPTESRNDYTVEKVGDAARGRQSARRLFRAAHPARTAGRSDGDRPRRALPAVERSELYHRRRVGGRRREYLVAAAIGSGLTIPTFVIPDLIRDPFIRRRDNGSRIKSGMTAVNKPIQTGCFAPAISKSSKSGFAITSAKRP